MAKSSDWNGNAGNPDEKTRLIRPAPFPAVGQPEDTSTVATPASPGVAPRRSEDGMTRLAGVHDLRTAATEKSEACDDPVVGWVVVVDGPGKGRSLPLGYGMNDVGRAPTCRVPLDFGDDLIARNQHAIITCDPRSLKFYVQHGGGKNLTYVGDTPVLIPQELLSGQEITLGATRLRFVALCGPEFDWQHR